MWVFLWFSLTVVIVCCLCAWSWGGGGLVDSHVHRQQVPLHRKCPIQLCEPALHLVWTENAQPPRQESRRGGRLLHYSWVWAGREPRGGNRLVSLRFLSCLPATFASCSPSFFRCCLLVTKQTKLLKYLLFCDPILLELLFYATYERASLSVVSQRHSSRSNLHSIALRRK